MKKVIFIGGTSYSGSTMLDMMLANNQNGFSVGEVVALFRPYRPHHFKVNCGCGNENCDLWFKVKKLGEDDLYKTIFNIYPEINYIVDSSKDPWWIDRQLLNLKKQKIATFNLLLYKEPIAYTHSMLKRKRIGWIRAWNHYYKLYFSLVDEFITIAYKDLAKNPSGELKKICMFCGIDYRNKMEDYWQKKHHTLFGNNSAKIHLYKQANEISQNEKDNLSQVKSNTQLQSIYYNDDYRDLLSDTIIDKLQHDKQTKDLLQILKSDDFSDTKKSIVFSPLQLNFFNAIRVIKKNVGYYFGRYWRIY